MKRVLEYIHTNTAMMGARVVYASLLLYYAAQQPATPRWAKSTIVGALGYLLSPIDSVPDLTPFLGFTDDLGVLMFALVTIACYITDDVRILARKRVTTLIPKVSLDDLAKIDDRL